MSNHRHIFPEKMPTIQQADKAIREIVEQHFLGLKVFIWDEERRPSNLGKGDWVEEKPSQQKFDQHQKELDDEGFPTYAWEIRCLNNEFDIQQDIYYGNAWRNPKQKVGRDYFPKDWDDDDWEKFDKGMIAVPAFCIPHRLGFNSFLGNNLTELLGFKYKGILGDEGVSELFLPKEEMIFKTYFDFHKRMNPRTFENYYDLWEKEINYIKLPIELEHLRRPL